MVKIEKPQALVHLDELIQQSDAVMVARGDLGVEMPPEDVPSAQKRIVGACRLAGKPVVVATQMLDSMVHSPAPTRAEASDVATAVYDGADAMMLSAETAMGQYPIEAVSMMNRIIVRVERDPLYRRLMGAQHPEPDATAPDAISAAAAQVAHTLSAAAIITYTTSGSTALRAARERPEVPIICLTPCARPRGAWPSSGAPIAWRPATSTASRRWWTRPAASPAKKAWPSPASASSSPPACLSAPPAQPMC
jgi:Pyruvate kinase